MKSLIENGSGQTHDQGRTQGEGPGGPGLDFQCFFR